MRPAEHDADETTHRILSTANSTFITMPAPVSYGGAVDAVGHPADEASSKSQRLVE
jgi:hypothetical protein